MSFWDFLKPIANVIGIATGNPEIGAIVNGIGEAAGTTEDNRNKARIAETGLNDKQDELALQRALNEQGNARANLAAGTAYNKANESDAVHGGFLGGVQDANITRPDGIPTVHVTGGARPSAIQGKEAMGQQFQKAALDRIAAGTPTLNTATPTLTPIPEANGFDKLLNVARGISGAYNTINSLTPAQDLGPQNVPGGGLDAPTNPNGLVNTFPIDDPNHLYQPPKPQPNLFQVGR